MNGLKALKKGITRINKFIFPYLNELGHERKCFVCNKTFYRFAKYKNGQKSTSPFIKHLNVVGSDPDNFKCIYCGSSDRERHLFMFFTELNLWDSVSSSSVLHFAPERELSMKLESLKPSEYIKADLFPKDESIMKLDATRIFFEDFRFDLIICNHVLEHIPDYFTALKELYRVLKTGGKAILQTPYSKLISNNFEDANISTEDQRLFFYGQRNHVRVFSQDQLFRDLELVGFRLNIVANDSIFNEVDCHYYGVNRVEDLVMVIKD
ncbi:MAG: class I SAM-dependent methyltransferase [Cyclobacteriaceae bacterium]